MFVGQVMVYGDGNSQGIAHAETIGAIKESLQLSENADELQKEFENAVDPSARSCAAAPHWPQDRCGRWARPSQQW